MYTFDHFCPQPSLQQYQARNEPSYIHRKNREAIEARKAARGAEEPDAKRLKRRGSVEPLERPDLVSPLPDLPQDLQQKQVRTNSNSNNNTL